MRKGWLVILLVFAVIGLAAASYVGVTILRAGRVSAAELTQGFGWGGIPMMRGWRQGSAPQSNCSGTGAGDVYGPGMMGSWDGRRGQGMMDGYGWRNPDGVPSGSCPNLGVNPPQSPASTRLTLDQAVEKAQSYIASDKNLTVSEVMEFENNFYAVVLEKDSGKGAMELLVDPYNGSVFPEMGPNMMWNQKYGHMGNLFGGGSQIPIEKAIELAQQTLDSQVPGAQVEATGIAFYGYFTFDYTIDGKIAGMLSVNSSTGDTWLHTWHAAFIDEIELVQ